MSYFKRDGKSVFVLPCKKNRNCMLITAYSENGYDKFEFLLTAQETAELAGELSRYLAKFIQQETHETAKLAEQL